MKIVLITPARSSSRSGNKTTSMRWAQILRELGHRVHIAHRYDGAAADLMVALHAWRSADSIRTFRELYPDRPLIVGLSGTDIYDYIDRDPAPTLHSLACANRLVALQDLAQKRVPRRFRDKVRIVHQSAGPLRRGRDAAMGGSGEGGDGEQSALRLARRPAACGGAAPARPRAGDGSLVAERRRSKRHIGGGRRRRTGARHPHRRLRWPARTRLSRLFSRWRYPSAGAAAHPDRDRRRIPQAAQSRDRATRASVPACARKGPVESAH